MKKTIIFNLILLIFINLLIKPIYLFGIDRKIQLLVGQSEYGFYVELLTFTLLFQALNDLGLYNYTLRHYSQNENSDKGFLSNLFGIKLIFSFIYLLIIGVITFLSHDYIHAWKLILHLAINQILIQFILFFRSLIAGAGFYKTDSILSSLDRMILILISIVFLYHPLFQKYVTIGFFVNLQTISLITCLMIALGIYLNKINSTINIQFDWNSSKKILVACLPFILIFFFNIAYTKQDVIWIGRLLENGNLENGIYASSMRLFDASSMISLSFGVFALAMFSKFHEDKKMITETLITMSKILLLISIGLAVFVFFNANWINQLLYHQNSIQMDQNLKIIMIGFIPASYSYLFGALMQSIHRENKLAIIYFAMMTLNAICNLIFIPKLHSYGASIALLITQIVVVVLMVYHTIDRLDNKLFLKFIGQSLSFMLVNITLHYFIYNYFTEQSEIVHLIISAMITLVLGVIFKLIDLTELKELYKKKEIK